MNDTLILPNFLGHALPTDWYCMKPLTIVSQGIKTIHLPPHSIVCKRTCKTLFNVNVWTFPNAISARALNAEVCMRLKKMNGVIKGGVPLSRNFYVRKNKIGKVALECKSCTSLN